MQYIGSVGLPTDNGALAGPTATFANPPISGMQAGDIIYIGACYRATSVTITIGNAGGQSFTGSTNHQSSTAVLTVRAFYAIFNGTWSAAPTVTVTSGTLGITAVMHVFRPTSFGAIFHNWSASGPTSVAAPGSPFTCAGNTGWTDIQTFAIQMWASDDDNTWGTLTGDAAWTVLGTAQYRNTQGSDTSMAFAYAEGLTVATASITQATLGGDPFVRHMFLFYEQKTKIKQLNRANARSNYY